MADRGATPASAASPSAGAALLARLKRVGVDVIFANSGTDFPPIIEALAQAAPGEAPEAILAPHEGAAVAMAHGHYLGSGRAQAVMVHTNVGLANAVIGAINAASDNVPLLLIGGRTPTLEKGRFGARTVPIGWGQEMLDQAALVREVCKWDYELRFAEQICDMVDRAYGIAASTPRGPVYVSLPREVLSEHVGAAAGASRPQMAAAEGAAPPEAIALAARWLADAERPAIFAQRGAGGAAGFEALSEMAAAWGAPVCQYWATRLAVGTDHPMAAGPDPARLLAEADVILVIDSLAPWSPAAAEPSADAKIIQLGPDPLWRGAGARHFRSDLSLAGETGPSLCALWRALAPRAKGRKRRNKARAEAVAAQNAVDRAARAERAAAGRDAPALDKPWVSQALSAALAGADATVFSELGCQLPYLSLNDPEAWFDGPFSGGLGWGFPAALGFKMARPERTVVATMGDGSYIFANPVACHQIAEARGLSIIVIVLNNAGWGAVRDSVRGLYPGGAAARANAAPLTDLSPSPDFTQIARASRAWACQVAAADAFEAALQEALAHTRADRGLALIEVAIGAR